MPRRPSTFNVGVQSATESGTASAAAAAASGIYSIDFGEVEAQFTALSNEIAEDGFIPMPPRPQSTRPVMSSNIYFDDLVDMSPSVPRTTTRSSRISPEPSRADIPPAWVIMPDSPILEEPEAYKFNIGARVMFYYDSLKAKGRVALQRGGDTKQYVIILDNQGGLEGWTASSADVINSVDIGKYCWCVPEHHLKSCKTELGNEF